ncbi:MAG TPA: hypothetical protein VGO56_18105 [Pyrinomonadaceae bacterium]|jgi:DNA-binding CsgD family transcriptional regulator|nr:hypothetical protein [Pyrinomonadaceae bacterium]
MINQSEISSTFYALRLITHQLDLSQVEVTEGDEYPATEFTPWEQARALEIIRDVTSSEQAGPIENLQDSVESVVANLADRIEMFANEELAEAGYDLRASQTTTQVPVFHYRFDDKLNPIPAITDSTRRKKQLAQMRTRVRLRLRDVRLQRLIASGRSTQEIARLLRVRPSVVMAARRKFNARRHHHATRIEAD